MVVDLFQFSWEYVYVNATFKSQTGGMGAFGRPRRRLEDNTKIDL